MTMSSDSGDSTTVEMCCPECGAKTRETFTYCPDSWLIEYQFCPTCDWDDYADVFEKYKGERP